MNVTVGLEGYVNIILQSFTLQLNAITILGNHRERHFLLQRQKELAIKLLSLLRDTEEEAIAACEQDTSAVVDETASVRDQLAIASSHIHDQQLAAIANEYDKYRSNLVKALGQEEVRFESELLSRFKEMKAAVSAVLTAIHALE